MNSSLFKKNQFKKLCSLLGSNTKEVEFIVKHLDEYYGEWREPKKDKETGEVKKYKDGTVKERLYMPPRNKLKFLQENIKKKILDDITLPNNIQGSVKRRSNITNAELHKGKTFKFTTDLQDFYPNINPKQVYSAFIYSKLTQHYAHWLTRLTTWKKQLPQGTSTSPAIANLVFLKTDHKLIEFCNSNEIQYTRYVDDLTFSSQKDFKDLLNKLLSFIITDGFIINYRKTKYKGDQTITGIQVFNNFIDAPEKIKIKARNGAKDGDRINPHTQYVNSIRRRNRNMKYRGIGKKDIRDNRQL